MLLPTFESLVRKVVFVIRIAARSRRAVDLQRYSRPILKVSPVKKGMENYSRGVNPPPTALSEAYMVVHAACAREKYRISLLFAS